MKPQNEEPQGAGPVIGLLLVSAWLALFHVIGTYTWNYGRLTFVMLTLVGVLLLASRSLASALDRLTTRRPGRLLRGRRASQITGGLALLALLMLSLRMGLSLRSELEYSRNRTAAIDIAVNTYAAGSAFLKGKNPYREKAQFSYQIQPGLHAEVNGAAVKMYGVPYTYGFPYFPAMFLSYLPFRPLAEGFQAIRLANGVFLLVNLIGIFWLTRRLSPGAASRTAGMLACVAYLGIRMLPRELFYSAVTDIVIATYALYAFLALAYGRFTLAGVLFGLAQACKPLPGPLLILPALVWLFGRPGFFRMAAAYLVTSLILILPFVVWQPELFLSSTTLFYLTNHAAGDSTSLRFFLPPGLKTPFWAFGCLASFGVAVLARRRRSEGLAGPLTLAFLSYLVFIAFNIMVHLNYIWGIYPLGCAALAANGVRAGRERLSADHRRQRSVAARGEEVVA